MSRAALHPALALAFVAVAGTVAVVALGAGSFVVDAAVADAGTAAVTPSDSPVEPELSTASSVEPELSTASSAEQSANLTAAVALPERAEASQSFVVRLERRSGVVVDRRNVTLSPGERTVVDFGACLPADRYTVRVTTPDGDVLVASPTQVEAPAEAVTFENRSTWGFRETVDREDGMRFDARYHDCTDRATFELESERGVAWRATVVDANGDGTVALQWHGDGGGLDVGDGDALENVTTPDEALEYGVYEFALRRGGEELGNGHVALAFAAPSIDEYTANRSLDASEALAAARNGESVEDDSGARNGESVEDDSGARIVEGNWIVLRIDTDGTLDSLPADARLVEPGRHDDATIHVRSTVTHSDDDLDLANATRRFDAANDTLWYAVRADADVDRSRVEYVAIHPERNATASVDLNVVDPVTISRSETGLLAPRENVSIRGGSALPEGTALELSIRADGDVLASDDVVVENDRIHATVDLADVPNGTNATVVVERDGRRVLERPTRIAATPVLELRGSYVRDGLDADESGTVRVVVRNRGTTSGSGRLVLSLGNATKERNVALAAGESRTVDVEFDADEIPERDRVTLEVSFAGATQTREFEVRTDDWRGTTATTSTGSTTTATGTEPWPTLVGSERTSDDSSIPGFSGSSAVAAVVAVAAAVGLAARRGAG